MKRWTKVCVAAIALLLGAAMLPGAAVLQAEDLPILPEVITSSLANGIVGDAYSQELQASGGEDIIFNIQGALPPGLTLTGGQISGVPMQAGSYSFVVIAQAGELVSEGKALSITVHQSPAIQSPATLPDGVVGSSYSTQITASGSPAPGFTLDSGSLPPGLGLSASGSVSGTPTQAGGYSFTVRAQNEVGSAVMQMSITIMAVPPSIAEQTLPGGRVGVAYSARVVAQGSQPIRHSITAGALPAGLSLGEDGTISGIPTEEENAEFTLTATNAGGSASRKFSIEVLITPAFVSASMPRGAVGEVYAARIQARGSGTLSFGLENGTLPQGLSLATNGGITGAPLKAGTSTFTIRLTGAAGSISKQFSITVGGHAPSIITPELPKGVVGRAYDTLIRAAGTGPISFSVIGKLPPGLSLLGDGTLSGTPKTKGKYAFTIHAYSEFGSASADYTLEITQNVVKPTLEGSTLPEGRVGTVYSADIVAQGSEPLLFELARGKLPTGLELDADTGRISGTPTKEGSYTFKISAANSAGSASVEFSIMISADSASDTLEIVTQDLPNARAGEYYSFEIEALGGKGELRFTVSRGALPEGLTLAQDGTLSGTPKKAESSAFEISVFSGADSVSLWIELEVEQGITSDSGTKEISSREDEQQRPRSALPWLLGGVCVIVAGLGLLMIVLALNRRHDDATDEPDPEEPDPEETNGDTYEAEDYNDGEATEEYWEQ